MLSFIKGVDWPNQLSESVFRIFVIEMLGFIVDERLLVIWILSSVTDCREASIQRGDCDGRLASSLDLRREQSLN